MENIKKHWKHIAAGLGMSLFGLMAYFVYRKAKSRRALAGVAQPLTKEEALNRSRLVKNLDYTLFLQLWQPTVLHANSFYEGTVKITFDLTEKEDLFIDFKGEAKRISLNQIDIEFEKCYSGNRIYLAKERLEKNNVLVVEFKNHYSSDVHGIRYSFEEQSLVSNIINSCISTFNDMCLKIIICIWSKIFLNIVFIFKMLSIYFFYFSKNAEINKYKI